MQANALNPELHLKTRRSSLFVNWQQTLFCFDIEQMAIEKTFANLVKAYSSPNRHYHTLKHIQQVLGTIDTLQTETENLTAVRLAAWFHDVVYNTHARDNEEQSAVYACQMLSNLGVSEQAISSITRLILNTKHHQAEADDIDSKILLDADLAILAAPQKEYWEYANAIRAEYAWVAEADYVVGRLQVLEKFLHREYIYFTPTMFKMSEAKARSNIEAEIVSLKNLI